MEFTELKDIPSLLGMINFERVFDLVSWRFIQETLEFFNFGSCFCKWMKTFQYNSNSCETQARFLFNFFKLGRGCRQIDPISPCIFLLCAEILISFKIRNNKDIKGIQIGNTKFLMSQYTDDTMMVQKSH